MASHALQPGASGENVVARLRAEDKGGCRVSALLRGPGSGGDDLLSGAPGNSWTASPAVGNLRGHQTSPRRGLLGPAGGWATPAGFFHRMPGTFRTSGLPQNPAALERRCWVFSVEWWSTDATS